MKSARTILPSAALLIALLAGSCTEGSAAWRLRVGYRRAAPKQAVVIHVSGDVTATRGRQTTTVGIGDALAAGQTLETGSRSECELRLGNGTAIRIDELTEILLDEVVLDPAETWSVYGWSWEPFSARSGCSPAMSTSVSGRRPPRSACAAPSSA